MRITFRSPSGRAYHLETDRFNPNILTAGSPGRIRRVAKHLSVAEIVEGDRGLTVVHGEYEGMPVSAFATGMGPASASITLPEAIELAEGSLTILRLGTAGSLQSFVRPGHLVVSTGCVRDERTTQAVVGPEYPAIADPELVPVIIAAAERHGYGLWRNLWAGITHVKDDLYFIETPHFSPLRDVLKPRLDSYRRMGVLASSMEFSVYCILRDFYQRERLGKISVGEILAVLSAPGEGGPVEIEVDKSKLEDDIIRIGLDALLAVYRVRKGEDPGLDIGGVIERMLRAPSPSELRTS
jgi:uridine phosphorylase